MEALEHIKRIHNYCNEYEVAEPIIEVSESWFRVFFPRPQAADKSEKLGTISVSSLSQAKSQLVSQLESRANRIIYSQQISHMKRPGGVSNKGAEFYVNFSSKQLFRSFLVNSKYNFELTK